VPHYTRVATGNITPYSFVALDTANQFSVLLCGANGIIFGVSEPGTHVIGFPFGTYDDGFAAIAGQDLCIMGFPEIDVMLQINGTVTRGDRLKSDATGFGITTTSTGNWVGAVAEDSGVAGQLIPVQLISPAQY
jgi:hypothetical protein